MDIRKRAGRVAAVVCSALMLFGSAPVFAQSTVDKINEQNQKIDALEEQKAAADQAVSSISDQVNQLNDMLSGLNTNLSSLSNSIETLTNQIADKKEEIEQKQGEVEAKKREVDQAYEALTEAQEKAKDQYADMKKRIQFMYENGDQSMLMALFSAKNISDFLSKAEYVESISAYDRRRLILFRETAEDIAKKKKELEAEQALLEEEKTALDSAMDELTAMEKATEQKKSQVSAAISTTQNSISESAEDLQDAKAMADELAAQIEKEKAYELELERQKAAEDAARQAEIKAAEAANTGAPVISDSLSDQELLSALIYCEAGGEPYDGQVAVGCVVMNRVRSSAFPNTVSGVIYQSGQFSPVASGRLATVLGNNLTTDSCRDAAATVLAGNLPYPDFLYFRSARVSLPFPVTWIANQQFY
ncbi:MAG: cell wall hydrolase [Lachnospiraceae bacterium]|nr:cell wall hydrolase [Lachnospiraceae bacterium]